MSIIVAPTTAITTTSTITTAFLVTTTLTIIFSFYAATTFPDISTSTIHNLYHCSYH